MYVMDIINVINVYCIIVLMNAGVYIYFNCGDVLMCIDKLFDALGVDFDMIILIIVWDLWVYVDNFSKDTVRIYKGSFM